MTDYLKELEKQLEMEDTSDGYYLIKYKLEGYKKGCKDTADKMKELFSEGFYHYLWTNYSDCKLDDKNFNLFVGEFEKKIKELSGDKT